MNTLFGIDIDFLEQETQDCVLKIKNMWKKNADSSKQR
jgi:hypothetical protein